MFFSAPPPPDTKLYPAFVATLPSLEGRTIAVTGCTSGTGRVFAETVGRLGARVLLVNRASERSERVHSELTALGLDAVPIVCDLQRFDSVREAGAQIRSVATEGLDVLCNNAGVMAMPDRATSDGFDVQMQSNHLSHFLLTAEVWPALEKAVVARGEARVVNHSSGARLGAPLKPEYLQAKGGELGGDGFPGLGKWNRYRQSKLANLLFTYALHTHAQARGGTSAGVKSLCAHPGPTHSGLQAKTAQAGGTRWLDRYLLTRALREGQSVEDGALGITRACCEPGVQSGAFYGPGSAARIGEALLLPEERDPAGEALLWEESLRAVGLKNFFPQA